jgi:hypothetical protein
VPVLLTGLYVLNYSGQDIAAGSDLSQHEGFMEYVRSKARREHTERDPFSAHDRLTHFTSVDLYTYLYYYHGVTHFNVYDMSCHVDAPVGFAKIVRKRLGATVDPRYVDRMQALQGTRAWWDSVLASITPPDARSPIVIVHNAAAQGPNRAVRFVSAGKRNGGGTRRRKNKSRRRS